MYTLLQQHMPSLPPVVFKILLVMGILLACLFLSKILESSLKKAFSRISRLDKTFLPVFNITIKYSIFGIGVLFILNLFGVNTTSLLTLMGAAGLAVGLALKDTLSNIAAGLMLLFLHPFRNGDYIETGAANGTVREINLFVTKLDTPDGLYICVPNSVLWGAPIKNFSYNFTRRIAIEVGISYSDSVDKAFEMLRQIIQEDSRFLQDPVPQIILKSLGDSSVNIEMRAWTKTADYWNVYWDTNKKVKLRCDETGISIPFPQRDIHFYKMDEK